VPLRHMPSSTTASFRAFATLARRMPKHFTMAKNLCLKQGPASGLGEQDVGCLVERLAGEAVACLLIWPSRSVSPGWQRRGVRPTCAPAALDLLSRAGSSMAEQKVSAVTGPMPGTVISLRQTDHRAWPG
jgi:hypothetical protein